MSDHDTLVSASTPTTCYGFACHRVHPKDCCPHHCATCVTQVSESTLPPPCEGLATARLETEHCGHLALYEERRQHRTVEAAFEADAREAEARYEALQAEHARLKEERDEYEVTARRIAVAGELLTQEIDALRGAHARWRASWGEAAVILEGLNLAVQWELAPAIKKAIAKWCEEARALLAEAPQPTSDQSAPRHPKGT